MLRRPFAKLLSRSRSVDAFDVHSYNYIGTRMIELEMLLRNDAAAKAKHSLGSIYNMREEAQSVAELLDLIHYDSTEDV